MSLLVDYEPTIDAMRTAINTAPTSEEFGIAYRGDWATVKSTFTTERTIDDIVNEKLEQYKELMRLQALGCKNCGGSIDKETMICDYCGTRYRN